MLQQPNPNQIISRVLILALTPTQIEAISGADDAVEYVNSFPKFRDMLEKGTGYLPPIVGGIPAILPLETDKLVKVWEDLQGFKGIISGKASSIQKRRELERIQRYITAERITRVKPLPLDTVNTLADEMKAWYKENENSNIYAKLCFDEEGKIDLKNTDIDGWLTEVYRAVFDQLYRVCIGTEKNDTSEKTLKLRLCKNDKNCDNLILVNGPKVGGKGKKFCEDRCRNQFHARKGMRKLETRRKKLA